MKMKVFESVNLIVSLHVTHEDVCTLVEVVVLNLFYWVYRSIIVEGILECRVVGGSGKSPLPVATPVLELLVAALNRAGWVHCDGCANSICSTRNCL